MRRAARALVLPLVAALWIGAVCVAAARPGRWHLWMGSYEQARCLGPCCLITSPFVELSCGEYSPPAPSGP